MDASYLPYCSERQAEILQAVIEEGSNTRAARKLEIHQRNVEAALQRIRKNAASQGYAPEYGVNTPLPPGQALSGLSQRVRTVAPDGSERLQWVKSQVDKTELTLEAIKDGLAGVKAAKRIKQPKTTSEDWLFELPIGDAHIGLYAHHSDGGGDYDLRIAYDDFVNAAFELIEWSRPAERCLIANVGDYYHADDVRNQTPQNKNPLDVDNRRYKVLTTGLQIMCAMVDEAAKKHKYVHVRNARGNHDPNAHMALTLALKAYYRNNPRITIEDSQQEMWAFQFGKNLIGVTHGDTIKSKDMAKVLAHDYASEWGRSLHRYVHYGHLHSTRVDEDMGCDIERFRILAPNDTYHQQHGYRSKRGMTGIMYHKEHGQADRLFCSLTRIKELGLSA